MSGIFKQFLLF